MTTEKYIPTPEEIAADKEAKKLLVVQKILEYSFMDEYANKSPELQAFAKAASTADSKENILQAEVLCGGYSNFSYKVFLQQDPSVRVFCKLTFPHAFWNLGPDAVEYDLERTQREFEIMDRLAAASDKFVAQPYVCETIQTNMKIFVTQWSVADEQLAHQMVRGKVDPRISLKLANALATVHTTPTEHTFNDSVRPFVKNAIELAVVPYLNKLITNQDDTEEVSRLQQYAQQQMGAEKISILGERILSEFDKKECLIHCDAQCLNILVESPPLDTEEDFSPLGRLALCDWEMALVGPMGRDIGMPMCWPYLCALVHAFSGRPEAVEQCLSFCRDYRQAYAEAWRAKADDEKDKDAKLRNAIQTGIAQCGMFMMHCYHIFGAGSDILPYPDDTSLEDKAQVQVACGMLALQFMELGYLQQSADSMSIDQLWVAADEIVQDELQGMAALADLREKASKTSRRRASSIMLQASLPGGLGRQSDAEVYLRSSSLFLNPRDSASAKNVVPLPPRSRN